jgi:MFS family permease
VALLFMFVRDYQTVSLVEPGAAIGGGRRMKAHRIAVEPFRPRSGVAAYIGVALQLVTVSTVYAWLPSYLNRFYGLPVDRAGMQAALVIIAGSIGAVTWAGSPTARAARRRAPSCWSCRVRPDHHYSARQRICGVSPARLQFTLINVGAFTMMATTGPIPAVAIDVMHPGLRTPAGSMVTVAQNSCGLAVGPLIAGALSDVFGLRTALALIPLSCALAAESLALGSRAYQRDPEHARAITLAAEEIPLRERLEPRREGAFDMADSMSKSPTPVSEHLRTSGNFNPAWNVIAELDAEWLEKFLDMGVTPMASGVLDPKTWEFIAIAVDASCTHTYPPGCTAISAMRWRSAPPRKRSSPCCRP